MPNELVTLDKLMAGYLRVLELGKACVCVGGQRSEEDDQQHDLA